MRLLRGGRGFNREFTELIARMRHEVLMKRGRPRKEFDHGTVFHMMANKAPVAEVARHLGVHRSTVYRLCRQFVFDGRTDFYKRWQEIMEPIAEAWFRKYEEKQRKKRQYNRRYF